MRICLGLLLVVVSMGDVLLGQRPRFLSIITMADYYRPEFLRPNNDDAQVWFVGEELVVEWELFNGGAQSFRTVIPTGGVAALLNVRALQAPAATPRLSLAAVSFSRRLNDRTSRGEAPTGVLELMDGEAIYLRATLHGLSAPGLYEIQIRPAFDGPYSVNDRVKLELRAPATKAERAEEALRRVARAFDSGNCNLARSESARLLTIHPYSSGSYRYQAECARREGRRADAAAAYSQARDMLDQRLDDLLIENKPGEIKRRSDEFAAAAIELARQPDAR